MQNFLSVFRHDVSPLRISTAGLVSVLLAEASSSYGASAFRYSRPENVGILTVIISKREFIKVERQILSAHVMVRSHDSAFQQAPKVINVASVNRTMDIFFSAVVDGAMLVAHSFKPTIAGEFVSCYQVYLLAHSFTDKTIQCSGVRLFDHLAGDISFAADCTDNSAFAGAAGNMTFLVPMTILVFSANVSFIHFNNAHESLKFGIMHSSSKPMAHVPSGGIGASNLPLNLECTNSLFAVKHLPENLKPCFQRHIGILKDRTNGNREAVRRARIRSTCFARPMERPRRKRIDLRITAPRACSASWPAPLHKEFFASIFTRECFYQLFKCHHNGESISQKHVVVKYFLIAQTCCPQLAITLPMPTTPGSDRRCARHCPRGLKEPQRPALRDGPCAPCYGCGGSTLSRSGR